MHADMASVDLSRRVYMRHALLILTFPLVLFVVPPLAQWTGLQPLPVLVILLFHLGAYALGVFTPWYRRHPVSYSTFIATVNAAVCAATCAVPGRFVAPIWVLYFSYPVIAARGAPLSIALTIQFVAQPFVVGLAWQALGLSPWSENVAGLGTVSFFVFILYVFLAHASGAQREGLLRVTEEQERHRIASDLHDTLGAALAEIALWQSIALKRSDDVEARRALERSEKRARAAATELRSIVGGLKSGAIEASQARALLESRVTSLCDAAAVELTINAIGQGRIAIDRVHQLVKIAEEAVNNALRHGPPRSITIEADWCAPRLSIVDDGPGFDEKAIAPGFGLASMRARAAAMGTSLNVETKPGAGTRVAVG